MSLKLALSVGLFQPKEENDVNLVLCLFALVCPRVLQMNQICSFLVLKTFSILHIERPFKDRGRNSTTRPVGFAPYRDEWSDIGMHAVFLRRHKTVTVMTEQRCFIF